MKRSILFALGLVLAADAGASAQSLLSTPPGYAPPQMVVAAPQQRPQRGNLGGGFIEFLFGENSSQQPLPPPPEMMQRGGQPQPLYVSAAPNAELHIRQPGVIDPQFLRQEVDYAGREEPGTIVIDTPQRFLFLVQPGGRAVRYGIGVGRPGFTWSGEHAVTSMREWPDWHPPKEMLQRQPYLPPFMAGGPNNPLGARAMYLGSTLYRIHGSNEPWTIGQMVSSGCIRMVNEDVIDLYSRVKIGTRVIVI